MRGVVKCRCRLCQKLHENIGPHTKAPKANITVTKADGLAWYKTSEVARRGICRICGSGIFWEPFELDATGIVAGTLDMPTTLETIGHIFVSEKPDFYAISDDLPQYPASSDGALPGDFR